MKTIMRSVIMALVAIVVATTSFAQINVTTGQTAQQLAEFLAGPNITVTNAQLTGPGVASGQFTGTNTSIGFDSGVILSTGDVSASAGPNNATNSSQNNGAGGTAQMDGLAGTNTLDAITLEFDFEVQSSTIQFNYVFASEEYPEWAPPNASTFNDVFAFYISGAGITGEENIALVPNTTNPVAIDNINPVTNNQYYVDNTGGQDVQFDGYTTILEAKRTNLTPCSVYHLKLVIADAGDALFNSAVFLQENSLVQGIVNVQTQTVNSDNIALEGCIPASFTFSYDDVSNQDRIISFIVGGSAVNGVDYQFVDSSMTIVAGDTSATIFINAFSDGITEGQESIWIIYQPEPCSDLDTAFLFIDDAQPIDFTLDGFNLDCFDDFTGEIQVNASGGFPPYTYTVNHPNGSTSSETNNPITGLSAGTYTVQVVDSYGCEAEALVVGGVFDADTTFLPDVPQGQVTTYDAPLQISGFNPGQTITDVSQIQQICLTMEHSYLGDLQLTVESPSGQIIVLKQQNGGGSCDLGEPFASNPVDGANSNLTDPGVGYEYCFNASPIYGTMVQESNNFTHTIPSSTGGTYTDNYLPAGSYTAFENFNGLVGSDMNGTWTVHVTDQFALDNGYIFNWYISLIGDLPDTTVVLTQPDEIVVSGFVNDATCGGSDGFINTTITGAVAPYTIQWSNGATTENISGLSAGTYTMTVTDANGCQTVETFLVNNIGSLAISSSTTATSCFGGSDGAIDITPSGGTTPYTFSWSNGATTEDISGLTAGDYTVTMQDQMGCIISEVITVQNAQQLVINAVNVMNEECNTDNGSIDIDVTGGTGSYGYTWSNGSTSQDISGLTSGTYTVDVIDGNGCTATASYTLTNDVSNCSAFCFIAIEENTVSDEICGSGNGSIDVNILNAVAPVTYSWSNGATTEDISGLSAGTYTLVATDANNCSEVATFTVGNNTGNLLISSSSVSEENCGSANGSVDITISGGAQPYSFSWSNGATTEDISGLSAGDYTVTITDGNSCQTTATYTVVNNAGTLAASATIVSEICTSSNGSINQTVTGGNGVLTYVWSSGQTTEDISGLSAGTYTCTITDETGCYVTNTYTVDQTSGDISLVGTNVTNEICGNGQGAINITLTGNNLTYQWSNGATTEDISGVSAGDYSCTVTNAQGCVFNTGVISVINASGTLSVSTQLVTDEVCGSSNGSINMNVSGGTQPYTFAWSNGATTEDLIGLTAGTYSLTVTDANGCTEAHSITVGANSGTLAIQNGVITDEVCGNGNGAIDVITTGGIPALTYSWSNGATTEDVSGLSAGVYTITITDNNGCQATDTYTVQNQANNLAFTTTVINEVCSNGQGEIALVVTGGTQPYSYAWSNGATTATISGLSSGTYSCTITDNAGCSIVTGSISVGNAPNGMSASTVVTDAVCTNNGAIDLTVSGGGMPYTYAWSNGATTEDISGLAPGTYSYTVTDVNGCQVTGSADVIDNSGNMNYTFSMASEICGNGAGSIDLTPTGGTAPYTFAWSNGATTEDISGLSAGTYTCTITDNNGCTIATVNIDVTNLPGNLSISNIVVTDETCSNGLGNIDITTAGGQAPLTYAWSNGGTTEDISNLSSGTYTVTVSDANGCQAMMQGVVNSSPGGMSINNAMVTDENCTDGQGAIDISVIGASNPTTYVWSNGATTEDISGLSAGTYTVTVTDNNGCTLNETYTVSDNGSSLAITGGTVSDEYCGSGSGSISVNVIGGMPAYSYNWSNGGTTNTISNLSAGTYTVTVSDQSGCSVQQTFTVNNNAGNLVVTGVTSDETCGDGTGAIDITTNGGNAPLSFLWDNGATTEDLTGLSAGAYNLVVTDNFGCTASYAGTVANITGGLTVTLNTVSDENCGQTDGAVDVNVSGGSSFTYNWSNGATTEDISGVSAGTYTLTVTNDVGCSASVTATVANVTGGMNVTFSNVGNENCGNGQGFIDIEMTGSGPFTYVWSDGQTTQDAINLGAGVYTVTITDNVGCQMSETYTVNNQNVSNISATSSVNDAFCTSSNGDIDITVNGGFSPFTYSWDNGATTEDLSGVAAGDYVVTITDNVNCTFTQTVTVGSQNSGLGITGFQIQNEFCGNGNGEIEVFTGGTADDYYIDGVNNGGFLFTNLSSGDYLIAITDNFGCYADSLVTVGNNAFFNVSDVSVDETCNQSNGSIDLSVSGGGNYSYAWSNGATTEDISGLPAGTYTVTVSTTGGFPCSVDHTVTIVNNSDFTISGTVSDDFCALGTGSIDQTLTSGSGVTYAWSNGATTEDVSGLTPGTYTCTVSVVGGCTETFTYTVGNQVSALSASAIVTDDMCQSGIGAIDLTVANGTGPYTYLWDNAATTEDISGLMPNDYIVTITDQGNGCSITDTFTVANLFNGMAGTATTTDDVCMNGVGGVDLTVTGGSGSYAYAWDNSATTEDLTNVVSNTYTVTITDLIDNCVITETFTVGNQANGMIASAVITNETCGSGDGAIDLTVTGGSGTYTYLWSNSVTTEDLTNVSANTYSVTITDPSDGCTFTEMYTVNDTTIIFGGSGVVTNATCVGCTDGAVDVSMNSGTYTYSWSHGATTEDASGLGAGTYTLTATSGGCDTTMTFVITEPLSVDYLTLDALSLSVQPNPATTYFVVVVDMPIGIEGRLTLTDAIGKVVSVQEVAGKTELFIDSQDMAAGMYFVRLQSNKLSKTERVVIRGDK